MTSIRKALTGIAMAAVAAVIGLSSSSCSTPKQILYFQNIDTLALKPLTTAYEAVIKKDDRLVIVVSGADKMVCAPYNLTLGEMTGSYSASTNPEQATLSYLVDSEGNIDFPILGKIHAEGLTRNQLAEHLRTEIGKDVKDPIVYVSFKNYKITVLGEVRSPGTYTIDSEKVTLLQALGRAGDLNLTAKRDGIMILREENNEIHHYMVDLKNARTLQQPEYYLQQNDVIYVPASSTRVMSATAATGIWSAALSSIGTTISVVTLAVTLTRNGNNNSTSSAGK